MAEVRFRNRKSINKGQNYRKTTEFISNHWHIDEVVKEIKFNFDTFSSETGQNFQNYRFLRPEVK